MQRAVVVGGGVIGLSAAFALERRGWKVTVIEARTPGNGASQVNAGWICPSHAAPVPTAGLIQQSLRWMRHADSPLYIQPRPDPEMIRWLTAFWRHCNAQDHHAGTEALAELGRGTLAALDTMRDAGVSFEEHRTGIIHIYESAARLEKEIREFENLASYGITVTGPLWGDELRDLEPNLTSAIVGGFWLEQDRQVRPASFTAGLAAYLAQRGVEIRSHLAVTGFDITDGRVTDVRMSSGRLETDAVVIAAGAWTPGIARMAHRRVPIQAGKGYSLDYSPSPVEVRHALHVDAARHAVTPFEGMTRLAGTMEFSGINDRIRPERVEAIIRGAARTLRGWPTDLGRPRVGTGLRPMTPDGLPVIGYLPGYRNLAVASGHGMLGFSLAPATAEALADLMTTGTSPETLRPFDPARF